MTLPNVQALKVAYRGRLRGDSTLMGMIEKIGNGGLPSGVTWAKPSLEYGIQDGRKDREANTYGQPDGLTMLFRLMAHDRGDAPGEWDFTDCYAVLARAETVLTASPITVAGQTVMQLTWDSLIPEAMPPDDSGYIRMQTGALYRVRLY